MKHDMDEYQLIVNRKQFLRKKRKEKNKEKIKNKK